MCFFLFFFFSSRRRHTRFDCDWSSDVCSSDLTWIVLRIFNVDFAASTALFSGVLTLIPLVGPVLAVIPPLLLPLLTNTTQAIFVFVSLVALQQVIFNIIGPRIMSRAFNLHPI